MIEIYSTNTISIIIDIVTIVVISTTAYLGIKSLRNEEKMKKFQIIKLFMEDYSSVEMYNAIWKIKNWVQTCKNNNKDFAAEFQNLKLRCNNSIKMNLNDITTFHELDLARRKFTHFMARIKLFHDNKIITKMDLYQIISTGQIDFYLEIVSKLETTNNSTSKFNIFFKELKDNSKLIDN